MQFTNYSDFRTAVLRMIDGDDVSTSFSTDTLDLLIAMGEQRLYREVRSSTQDAALSVVVASNAAALPTDCLQLKQVYFDAKYPIEIIALDRLRELIGWAGGGNATYAALEGDSLIFWPEQTGTLLGRYYKKFDDISTGLNAFFNRYPELFLYAALAESAPFIGEDSRLQLWEAKLGTLIATANRDETWRAMAGPLRVRTR